MSEAAFDAQAAERVARAWEVLAQVLDPEVPALSICELGIVREVRAEPSRLRVALTPTYSGCPATELIEHETRSALDAAGLGPVDIELRRAPAWTTDWISDAGRDKLRAYGIAPPGPAGDLSIGVPVRFMRRAASAAPACPRCGSAHTEMLSAFGSTACKSLCRCLDCREPFEAFKPL